MLDAISTMQRPITAGDKNIGLLQRRTLELGENLDEHGTAILQEASCLSRDPNSRINIRLPNITSHLRFLLPVLNTAVTSF